MSYRGRGCSRRVGKHMVIVRQQRRIACEEAMWNPSIESVATTRPERWFPFEGPSSRLPCNDPRAKYQSTYTAYLFRSSMVQQLERYYGSVAALTRGGGLKEEINERKRGLGRRSMRKSPWRPNRSTSAFGRERCGGPAQVDAPVLGRLPSRPRETSPAIR